MTLNELITEIKNLTLAHDQVQAFQIGNTFDIATSKSSECYPAVWFELPIITNYPDSRKKIHGTGDNFVELPDYAVRHRYWDTMLKLKGRLDTKGGDVKIGQIGGEMEIKFIADGSNTKPVATKSSE